jgi:hypothetical protein
MSMKTAIRALIAWGAILVLAVLNGLLREALWIPWLGATAGLVASGLLLCAFILAATWLLLPWLNARGQPTLWLIGLAWLLLTLAFEFTFGLLRGQTLDTMLAAYRFRGGNLWPLVLATTLAAPSLAGRLRRQR